MNAAVALYFAWGVCQDRGFSNCNLLFQFGKIRGHNGKCSGMFRPDTVLGISPARRLLNWALIGRIKTVYALLQFNVIEERFKAGEQFLFVQAFDNKDPAGLIAQGSFSFLLNLPGGMARIFVTGLVVIAFQYDMATISIGRHG